MGMIRAFGSMVGARVLAAGMAFVSTILMARYLGPERYGALAVLVAIVNVTAGLVSPALDTTLVRFAARYRDTAPGADLPYFHFVFRLKLALAGATVLLGAVLAAPLRDAFVVTSPPWTIPAHAVFVAFLAAAVITLWSFSQAYFQARQLFGLFAAYECWNSLLRAGLVVLVLAIGFLGEQALLLTYLAAPLVTLAAAWRRLPREVYRGAVANTEAPREVLRFAAWIVLACVATALSQRADLFLLAGAKSSKEIVGHYGAAVSLVFTVELLRTSLFQVILPRASALTNPRELGAFLRQQSVPALGLGLALVPFAFWAGPIVTLVFGAKYAASGPLFGILLVGTVFVVGTTPAGAVIYAAGHSSWVSALEAAKLVAILAVGLWVVPRHGAVGLAWTIAGVRATIAVVTYAAALSALGRMTDTEGGAQAT